MKGEIVSLRGLTCLASFFSIYIYLALVLLVTLATLGVSYLYTSSKSTKQKYMPYESGIETETHLLQERFPLRHYLVGLLFLVFDIEVIFLYPWAVVAKTIGPFAFYEMVFFLIATVAGLAYVWRKGGLEWD